MKWCALLLAAASLFPQAPPKAGYAITGVRILDPVTGRYSAPSAVLITGSRIERIIPVAAYRRTMADSTIDLNGKFLLPGLIDGHVHFSLAGPIRANALATVQAGFTTVADLGARGPRVLRFRDSVNAGTAPGPRILAVGLWIGIQGGVCEFSGLGIAGGSDAFRQRVIENVQAGADLIKLCVSGWPAESFANPDKYELSDSILSVSVKEAHRAGKLVIAHDLSAGGVRAGLRAGIDGLAHAAFVDSGLAVEMKRRNVFLIPTLASLTGGDSSQAARALIEAVRLAHRLGVSIVFGTDAGVIRHGDNAIEFAALQGAGLTPLDAIRAATINAARAFRLADSVGQVKTGMLADLIALSADPLLDPSAFRAPSLVMARGRVVPRLP
jgi:imidazolonepropionase-like amidohydrolase